MQTILEYAVKNANIVLLQESWIEKNNISISHFAFTKIAFNNDNQTNFKARTMTFISKSSNVNCTSRYDISNDSDIQILDISSNIENFMIFNVYNEKNQGENQEYTVERKLISLDISEKAIICENFNAHNSWWNSKIQNSIRANALISWINKFNCELINTSDEMTYTSHSKTSQSVLDLTFATSKLAENIIDWTTNDEIVTKSDHEVIAFNLLSKNTQKVDSSLNVTFNVQKANWNNFVKNLQSNYETAKLKMKVLIQTPNIENMKKMVILLRSTIENAIHENISKRRSCNQSKVWWSKNLTDRRKIMTYSKRQWKNSRIESDWDLFKNSRNDYFNAIREAKNKSWTEFLNNAKRKEVFQIYRYTRSRSVEKLSFISHNNEIKIQFDEKCDALIDAIFSSSSEENQKENQKEITKELNQQQSIEMMNNLTVQNKRQRRKWEKVIYRKIKNAIFSFSLKKAFESDEISFLIFQKSYHSISDLFHMIFFELIKNEYHFQCWKENIDAILKKSNKIDYSQSKLCRIITLLNCLRKIVEKIIATRLSHFVEHSNLSHNEQMKNRKNRFAIDASLHLLHNIHSRNPRRSERKRNV